MGKRLAVAPDTSAAETPVEAAESAEGPGPGLSLFDASGDNRVRCLWRDPKRQKWTAHGYFPPDVTEEALLKAFGGGDYMLQLLVQGGEGREVIKQTRRITLVGPHFIPQELPGIRDQSLPTTQTMLPGIPAGGDDLMTVLRAGIINTLLEMMKSSKELRPSGPDPMLLELMKQQSATQMKMMEFMLTLATKDDSGGGRKTILAEMLQYKELFTSPGSGAVPANPMEMFNNMLDTFKSFREAAEDVAPSRDNGDPVLNAIPKLVEVVAEQHQMQKAAAVRNAKPAVTSPVQAQLPAGENVPLWKRVLQHEGPRFVAEARAGRNPETIAAMSVEYMPPNIVGAMKEFFHHTAGEVTAQIIVEIPALAEQPTWVTEFVEHVQFLMFPDEFDEDGERIVETGVEDAAETETP